MIITPFTTIKELFESLQISVRTYNCLTYCDINDVQDLLSFINKGYDLRTIRNFGPKSEYEIAKVKEKIIFDQTAPDSEDNNKFLIPNEIRGIFISLLNQFIEQYPNCSKCFVDKYSKSPANLYQNIKYFHGEFFLNTNLSKEDNLAYRKTCCEFVDLLCKKIKGIINHTVYLCYIEFTNTLNSMSVCVPLKKSEELFYISDLCDSVLQEEFDKLCRKLGVRARNFINSQAITYKKLVPLFNKTIQEYGKQLCPSKFNKKTLFEIFEMNFKFEKICDKYYKLSDNELYKIRLQHKYPFLIERQRLFVSSFEDKYGYMPCYFLLYNYLKYSEERSDKLYSLYYGIFDNCPRTLDDLAELNTLSRERVRQIVKEREINAHFMFFCQEKYLKAYLNVFKKNIITEYSNSFQKIASIEKLNISFDVFAALTCVLSNYFIYTIKDKTILISSSLNCNVKIKNIILRLENIINGRYSQDTTINIDMIIENVENKYKAELRDLLTHFIQYEYKIPVSGDGNFILSQNYVDVDFELVSILEDSGRPMYLQELFERFNLLFPDHRVSEAEKLRPHLLKSTRIKSIGRQSLYGLSSWENVFFGSIPDFLVEILNESKSPLRIEKIYSKVVENFPNTTIKSVVSFLSDAEIFVSFQNNDYGLRGKIYSSDCIEQPSISRYKFADRISMFREFVNKYERFPLASGGDTEGSLQRWYHNVLKGVLDVTYEQKAKFDELVVECRTAAIPQSETENKFYNNCIKYKDYIKRFHKLPSTNNGGELYFWFVRSKSRYEGFADNRFKYFNDLMLYIRSFGFVI